MAKAKLVVPFGEKEALSVEEFCGVYAISRAMFYRLRQKGTGPEIFKLGRRTLISREAAAAWRRSMEQAFQATG